MIEDFPPTTHALEEPNGLLAVGGDLCAERLLLAYSRGIFPWFSEDDPILWWSPSPRAVLFPNCFRLSKSLRKSLKNKNFKLGINHKFETVMRACAAPRKDGAGTWISNDMVAAYSELHRLGYAHSIEVYREQTLVGGLYGINLGRVFFGESMFTRCTDASKTALAALVWLARNGAFDLIDCQVESAHLTSLGAVNISREAFENLLVDAINDPMDLPKLKIAANRANAEAPLTPDWTRALPLTAAELLSGLADSGNAVGASGSTVGPQKLEIFA